MEEQSMEDEISIVLRLSQSTNNSNMIIEEQSTIAPVIIEELEASELNDMNVDLNEFVVAEPLEVCQVTNNDDDADDDNDNDDDDGGGGGELMNDYDFDTSDNEDNNTLSPEEEAQLTRKFLDGEVTFSHYSAQAIFTNTDGGAVDADETGEETRDDKSKAIQVPVQRKRGKKRIHRRKKQTNLPPVLKGLMGEANMRFARGDHETAKRMCLQIIQEFPSAPEPFMTLSLIYENEDPEKALEFKVIAAHLGPKDATQWFDLAKQALDTGDVKKAITYYTKAIQADPKNIELYDTRASLYQQSDDWKSWERGYLRLISVLGSDESEELMEYAGMLTDYFLKKKNWEQALQSLEQIFNKCPQLVSIVDVSNMAMILLTTKQFTRCLDILNKFTDITIKYTKLSSDEPNKIEIHVCEVPDFIDAELKAKVMSALIELDFIERADEISANFLTNTKTEACVDLYLDVAEAFMSKKEYYRALKFFPPLINNKSFVNFAAVWLRYAECWVGVKNLKKAILCYEIVTFLSPEYPDARLQLATLYNCFKQHDLAVNILKQNSNTENIDARLLYKRTMILYKMENYEEFLKCGFLLVSRHCERLRSRTELEALMKSTVKQRIEALNLHRLTRGESLHDDDKPSFNDEIDIDLKDEMKLFTLLCEIACKLKKFGLLERMCFSALTSKKFECKTSHIIFLCLLACIYNDNSFHAYNLMRELLKDGEKPNLWNLLNIIIQKGGDTRHNRFLLRHLSRDDAYSYRHILNANNCLVSGTYKYALNDYAFLFRVKPCPLLALLIAVTFLQLACQKFAVKRHSLVTQANAFFKKYAELRGVDGQQESNYNIARALHQLGLFTSALYFYKLVLESPIPKLVEEHQELLDLKKETAYNVHLIYMHSGNYDLARIENMGLALKMTFLELCQVFEDIQKARGNNMKTRVLQSFIKRCRDEGKHLKEQNPDADISLYPIMRLFFAKIDKDRGPYGFQEKVLGNLYIRIFCLGKGTPDADKIMNYREPANGQQHLNDFAERVYWVIKPRMAKSRDLSIEEINTILDRIAQKNKMNANKDGEFIQLIQKCDSMEMKWITRLILKKLTIGLSDNSIFNAYHPDAERLFAEKSNLREVFDTLIDPYYHLDRNVSNIIPLQPFRPVLLQPLSIEDIGKFFYPNKEEYIVQTKYDGERSQLHMKNGHFKYYTRHGLDITSNECYGESVASGGFLTTKVSSLLSPNCTSIILDGELMCWHKSLQEFIKQGKSEDVKLMKKNSECQPCFVAFDVLLYNDELLVNKPLTERLKILESAFTECKTIFERIKSDKVRNTEDLREIFVENQINDEEGIVVKKSDSPYLPNERAGGFWYKIKSEYSRTLVENIDMVVIGGYYGRGKYSGTFRTFLMAVADVGSEKKFYTTLVVGTGLSAAQLNELNAKFKPHWTKICPATIVKSKKYTPHFWINPENSIILELAASSIVSSKHSPIGYTLNNPRVVKIRNDKPWYDAWTVNEYVGLVRSADDGKPGKSGLTVNRLNKRHVTADDIVDVSLTMKRTRNQPMRTMKIDARHLSVRSFGVTRLSRLFEGKKICVINGEVHLPTPGKLTKADIETIVISHAGTIVQNPNEQTFCVLAGVHNAAKVENLVKSEKYDVVTLDWFKRAINQNNWDHIVEYYPWELLSCNVTTFRRLTVEYDEFHDHFSEDSDLESLRRSMKRIMNMNNFEDIDMNSVKLLQNKLSPFTLFQNIVGYFVDPLDDRRHEFDFMNGSVRTEIDETVTHIFVNDSDASLVDLYNKRNKYGSTLVKIVKSEWINECFMKKELLRETHYIIN